MKSTRSRAGAALVAALALIASTGCGERRQPTTPVEPGVDDGAAPVGTDEAAAYAQAARDAVDRDVAGTDRPLPETGPAAVPDKEVWAIACRTTAPGCGIPAEAVGEAGAVLGWNTRVIDGKYDPGVINDQIRTAITASADAIVLVGLQCEWATASLQEARAAGVVVYGLYSTDCDEAGGEPLFDAELHYGETPGYLPYVQEQIVPAVASYVIASTEGRGQIIQLRSTEADIVGTMGTVFAAEVEERCPTCQLHTVEFNIEDLLQDRVQSKTATALIEYPDADVVVAPYDALVLLGVGASVQQAKAGGREVMLTGLEGFEQNLQMIAQGGPQNYAAGMPARWAGWAAADGLNRLFAGAPQVDAGIGYQSIDLDNPPPTMPYEGNERSLAWEDNYRRIWAGG